MLQELAAQSGATAWAIGSMLFFLAAWIAVVVWLVRKRPEELDAHARLPFGDEGTGTQKSPGAEGGQGPEGSPRGDSTSTRRD
jgi:hypothetical protein